LSKNSLFRAFLADFTGRELRNPDLAGQRSSPANSLISLTLCKKSIARYSEAAFFLQRDGRARREGVYISLDSAVAGLKMAHLLKITAAFEFSVLTLTVPGLRLRKIQNPLCF
jgi:hypothetical protein